MDEKIMKVLLREAKKANQKGEIPVSAVILKNGKIIARARNTRQYQFNVLGHAEINAIKKAGKKIKDWRLDDCIMYVTLEPCELCQKVIAAARLKTVYYIKKNNYNRTNIDTQYLKWKTSLEYDCLFKNFFKTLR